MRQEELLELCGWLTLVILSQQSSPDLAQFLIFFTPPAQPVFSVDTNISLSDGRLLNMWSPATTGFISDRLLILKCRGQPGGQIPSQITTCPALLSACLLRHTNTETKVSQARPEYEQCSAVEGHWTPQQLIINTNVILISLATLAQTET